MAVTGAIFNSLVFGGVNSADYGIYITGEAVFNAPSRAVETVSVPGRNGDIIIDQGHWENIEVTYPAGTFGMSETEFRTALSDFRNAIVSQLGYQRLSDTYHPDEYRMATYVEGLEVDAKNSNKAGQFNLVFNCKPQRWLTSGETAVTVSSGDTLTNPTLYDAGPLIALEGYGTLNIGGYEIVVGDGAVGDIVYNRRSTDTLTFEETYLNDGDVITVNEVTCIPRVRRGSSTVGFTEMAVTSATSTDGTLLARFTSTTSGNMQFYWTDTVFSKGTPDTKTAVVNFSGKTNGSAFTCVLTVTMEYAEPEAGTGTLKMSYEYAFSGYTTQMSVWIPQFTYTEVTLHSTQSYLGHPTYIDCEIGEVYKKDNGVFFPLNAFVGLGSDLPALKPGATEITFSDTLTELKITPRWWKL